MERASLLSMKLKQRKPGLCDAIFVFDVASKGESFKHASKCEVSHASKSIS